MSSSHQRKVHDHSESKHVPEIKWQLKLLQRYWKEDYLEEIEGDLIEQFEKRVATKKPAQWLCWLDMVKLMRPQLLKPPFRQKPTIMLGHNIKISFRSFKRHKSSFLINYAGLVCGLVTTLLIYLWVNHELNVDRFHEQTNQMYRLVSDSGGSKTLLNTNPFFAEELASAIPEIEYVVNSAWGPLISNLGTENEVYFTRGEFGSPEFFEFFSYPLLQGDPSMVLKSTQCHCTFRKYGS